MASNVEWVVRWLVVKAHARAPGTPTMHKRLQKAFADAKAAVTFVMTGLALSSASFARSQTCKF
jgi:hypothetical protein